MNKQKIISILRNIFEFCLLYLMVYAVQFPMLLINMKPFKDNSIFNSIMVILYFVVFGIAISIARKAYLKNSHHQKFQLTKSDIWKAIKYVSLALIVEMSLDSVNQLINNQIGSKNNQIIQNTMNTNKFALVAMAISTVCLSPVLEELIFRGFIINSFFSEHAFWMPILVSSALFAVGHTTNTVISLCTYFILGVFLSYAYKKTNNIKVSILMHSINNFLAMTQLLIFIL